ncbi:related to ANT1-Peroxisomal transporter of adenine nucleotides (ATP, AMP)-member of the mitochondrial carrier family (MCF) [Sporisorium reilianum f. sp. reilianum]|uniref:Related to ANT1-Peroxisomal transporter of adenine nucleotides (ATP, AMP)-member of the mitochondrial carrier family (MCF) n=1 Tax=Sporisorium reilianum f. sp. reilianum TaxID=72559 RepID=A0A2N8UJD5_9BASI|nr:related to ANT1-Peroxisomal transporter of adenine nucleotides (ATP, AMP)-member of the mitochondrial carrier family (MCF) [Sporisorium reilianum f. sp. reilianum]
MAQSQLPPFAQATAGALGSITSNTLVYPLDLLSTRCQTQSRGRDGKGGYQSIGAALQEIVKQNGVKGLYQGLASDTLSNTLSNFLFFYFRSFFMESVKERKKAKLPPPPAGKKGKGKAASIVITAAEDLAIGALAGIVSRFFTTPLSNVTVRMQTSANPKEKTKEQQEAIDKRKEGGSTVQPSSDSESDDEGGYAESAGIMDVLRQIVAEKGWLGLWSGFETAALLSISPALTFYSTNAISRVLIPKESRDKPSSLQTFVTSALGNSVSTMIVFPLILCKTRLQWRSPTGRKMYRNLLDVLRKTVRKGGVRGLYQGLDSQLIKGLFSFGTTMMVKARIETLFVLLYLAVRNRRAALA